MSGYLLDTHVLVWIAVRVGAEVSPAFFGEVEQWQRDGVVFLSAVSSWEISLLVAANQLDLGMSVDQLWDNATQDEGLRVLPLTPRVLIESTRLPGDLHRDPADRMLVATAREYGLTLVTRDKTLLNYARQGYLKARKP